MNDLPEFKIDAQYYSEPLVTIGLPTYNRPQGLQKCLESIQRQTYRNFEIIVSDNCSTDEGVLSVIKSFRQKNNRIQYFRQEQNIGLEENFNFVFFKSTASYFIWMSDDDYFDDNYVEQCVKFLEEKPDYVLCSGIARYYNDHNFLFEEKMFGLHQKKSLLRVLKYFSKVGKNGNFYGVFRNELFVEKPIKNHIGCDWSFMAKLALVGKLAFIDTTSYHRSAEGNSGTKRKMIKKFGFNKFQSIFFETYSAYVIAVNIFNDAMVSKNFNWLTRKLIVTIIFFQINYKLFFNFIKKKLRIRVH